MGTGIKGFKSQKMLKSKLTGFTESQSIDTERYATVQELTGDKYGVDVVIHGSYVVTSTLTAGSNSNIRTLYANSHGAIEGDHIRFIASGVEASVMSVPDANTIILGSELDFAPSGLTFNVLRHITPTYNSDGSLNVSVTPSPVAYNRKSGGTTIATTVLEDLDTPANSRSLPTVLHSVDGAPVTTKLISGAVNGTDNSIVVNSVIHGLNSGGGGSYVDVKVNPSGALVTESTVVSSVLPTGAATSALQTTGNTSLSSIDTKLTSQATAANQTTELTRIGDVTEAAPGTDTASSGLNGRLQRVAQRLTSLIALLPASLGSKADAASLAVTQSTEDKAIQGALTETAPASDTASSGLNGRLQRIAQNITSMSAKLPALGTQTRAASQSVTLANDTNLVSTVNSSTATLGISAVFTGTSEDVSQYAETRITVISDQASATNGLSIQQSSNGTNWDITDTYTVSAGVAANIGVGISARFLRIVYTNGGVAQGSFRLQTVHHAFRTKPSSNRPQDTRSNEIDVEEVMAYSAGFNGTSFDRLRAGVAGAVSAVTGYLNVLPVAKYFATPPTLTNAQSHELLSDVNGNLRVVSKPISTTTTYAENLALTTVTTITAPANAVGVLIMADDANANNIRVRQGGSPASLTSGMPLQPGRDIKFDCGTDLSVISDNAGSAGASVKIYFQWYIQA